MYFNEYFMLDILKGLPLKDIICFFHNLISDLMISYNKKM